jgi:hypothetical protein
VNARPPLLALFAACLSALTVTAVVQEGAYAQSVGADWQMYGKSSFASAGIVDKAHGDDVLFFDAAGAVRRSDGHIEVWMKALPLKELRAQPAGEQMTKRFIDFSKQKVASGYMPPLSTITELDTQERAFVMLYETAANLAGIAPTVQMLFEVDCTNRVLRALSMHVPNHPSDDTASEWQHSPPETAGANLIKILCK